MRIVIVLLALLLLGCVGTAPQPTPAAAPAPTVAPSVIPTPAPSYGPAVVNETVERGDFLVKIISVGKYSYVSPFGKNRTDYRVDMGITNTARQPEEYRFAYLLFNDDRHFPLRWYSTLDDQGLLPAGGETEGYLLFDVGNSTGPFKLVVATLPLSSFDYVDVIGKNELGKPVAGNRMYGNTCGTSTLGEKYLGSLLGGEPCKSISAARDLYVYPSWHDDHVVIVRLKLKNSAEHGANVLVVDEIPKGFGVTAHNISYSKQPIFLDSYHPAWLIHLSRNEIWKTDMNYSIFLDGNQVGNMPAPVVLGISL